MSIAAVPSSSPSATDETFVQAFGDIYREHYQLVYRTAYSVTGSRQDAEDVLQTVFMNLLDRDLSVELMRSPKAYLYRAAINAALNTIRSRKRHNLVDGVEDLEATAPAPSSSAGPGDLIRRKLLNAIAKLKPKEVEILILRYEHDYSDVEIAKMLGKSRGTIAVTLYRTRARLKKLLRTTGDTQ
jgi:RNA polymerase sigma-70 factor (ECF subfamily)